MKVLSINIFVFVMVLAYLSEPVMPHPVTRGDLVSCISKTTVALKQQVKKRGILLIIQRASVRFPATGLSDKPITCVEAIDTSSRGRALAFVSNGGVGKLFIEITLLSEISQPLDFDVSIYTE